jgi:hypothetical protein
MRDLTDELAGALRGVGLLASAVKSGEPWTGECEHVMQQVRTALAHYDEARARRESTTHDATCYELGPRHYECALAEIERLGKRQGDQSAVMQEDMRVLLDALGLYSGARPESPHRVMRDVVIPAVERLRPDAAAKTAATVDEIRSRLTGPNRRPTDG